MKQYDVLLIGRTPASAILARNLAGAGRSIALIDDGMIPGFTGSIRWLTLRDLGLADRPEVEAWPCIRVFRERALLEDGVRDTVYHSDKFQDLAHRTLVTQAGELFGAIIAYSVAVDLGSATPSRFLRVRGRVVGVGFADGSEISARLTIVTSGNRTLLGARERTLPDEIAPPFYEQLDIAWPGRPDTSCEQVTVTGGPLTDVEATAILHLAPGRTALSLVVSAAQLVREAVVVSDVLDRLLRRSAMEVLPPLAEASSAALRLLTLPERVDVDRYGPGSMVLGAMQGISDPARFDREVRLSQLLADELAMAPVERYGSASLHCAIAASLKASDWTRREPRPRWNPRNADDSPLDIGRLDRTLARSARVLPST